MPRQLKLESMVHPPHVLAGLQARGAFRWAAVDSLIIIPTSNAESSITENISRILAEAAAERLSRCIESSFVLN
jgi:hypothetical protein